MAFCPAVGLAARAGFPAGVIGLSFHECELLARTTAHRTMSLRGPVKPARLETGQGHRIDVRPVLRHLEVDVRPGCVAGRAG